MFVYLKVFEFIIDGYLVGRQGNDQREIFKRFHWEELENNDCMFNV